MTFAELDWTRFDCWALVACRGVAVVNPAHYQTYRSWLRHEDYAVSSFDFAGGISPAVEALGKLLRWEEQFGYTLGADNRNLNALRDGFEFSAQAVGGVVLELLNAEFAYAEDPSWFGGLLSIASGYSLEQLALGQRFFTTLVLAPESKLVGTSYKDLEIPVPFWLVGQQNPF